MEISLDTILNIYIAVVDTAFFGVIIYWMKFDKKQAKKRKPRQKRADVQVTVPTNVKVVEQDDV